MKFIFIFIFLLVSNKLISQTNIIIQGIVVDNETKQPIPNTLLYFGENFEPCITNENGFFYCQVPENITKVTFKNISYHTLQKSLIDLITSKNNEIKLYSKIILLEEVVIKPENPQTLIKNLITNNEQNIINNIEGEAFYTSTTKKFPHSKKIMQNVIFNEVLFEFNKNFEDKNKLGIDYKILKSRYYDGTNPIFPFEIYMIRHSGWQYILNNINLKQYPFLSIDNINKHNFEIDSIIHNDNDDNTYVISFNQKKKNKHTKNYEGKIWVKKNLMLKLDINSEKSVEKSRGISEITNTIIEYDISNKISVPIYIVCKDTETKYHLNKKDTTEISITETNERIILKKAKHNLLQLKTLNSISKNTFSDFYNVSDSNYDYNFWENTNIIPFQGWQKLLNISEIDIEKNMNDSLLIIFQKSYKKSKEFIKGRCETTYQIIKDNDLKENQNNEVFFEKFLFGTFGSKIYTKNKDESIIFDGKTISIINHKEKMILQNLLPWESIGSIEKVYENSGIFPPIIKSDLFFSDMIQSYINRKIPTLLHSGTIDTKNCWIISQDITDNNISTHKHKEVNLILYIDKANYLPIQVILKTKYKPTNQEELEIWKLNKIDEQTLNIDNTILENFINYTKPKNASQYWNNMLEIPER